MKYEIRRVRRIGGLNKLATMSLFIVVIKNCLMSTSDVLFFAFAPGTLVLVDLVLLLPRIR